MRSIPKCHLSKLKIQAHKAAIQGTERSATDKKITCEML